MGGTGCGKSTQIPQMLLKEAKAAIMCTQPRRLAVVAIATRVAQERGSVLGQEVGYQIGQQNITNKAETKLSFVTAGILLELLKQEGEGSLEKYQYLVIDEVHERSVESDVMLSCIRSFLLEGKLKHLRIVLMSATADIARYGRYFEQGGKRPPVLVVDSESRAANTGTLFSCEQKYLDDAERLLSSNAHRNAHGTRSLFRQLAAKMTCQADASALALDDDLHQAVALLVTQLATERGAERSGSACGFTILVFCPTWRALEKQHELLLRTAQGVLPEHSMHVLHSTIDVDTAMKAICLKELEDVQVILATNVAESSLTIPSVVHVIDLCLTNHVKYIPETGSTTPSTGKPIGSTIYVSSSSGRELLLKTDVRPPLCSLH
jgi:HrpA-like RNA helicase